MKPEQLDKNLNNEINTFKDEMLFLIDGHDGDYLTKDDMEDVSRQVFYTLHEMKKLIIQYASTNR